MKEIRIWVVFVELFLVLCLLSGHWNPVNWCGVYKVIFLAAWIICTVIANAEGGDGQEGNAPEVEKEECDYDTTL